MQGMVNHNIKPPKILFEDDEVIVILYTHEYRGEIFTTRYCGYKSGYYKGYYYL